MTKGKPAMLSGSSRKDVTAYAFGAHIVEVHVHSRTREIRVRRITSAFAAGTIVNSLVPEKDDRVNSLGIKGIGEIGIVGMNAAVANAVFNATGKRVRDLPIRAEKLL